MTNPSIKLGDRTIGHGQAPYLIAEIGVNHEGNMALARRLIELAKEGGADAAKFQTYKAATLASANSPAYWDTTKEPTESQFKLFQKYDSFEADDYVALAEHCRKVGIDFISTPFDANAVELLDPLMHCYKIASADITNVPLLRQVGSKGKPVLMSTGAATLGEIEGAVRELEHVGCADIVLLQCVLNYPCPNENAHLNMIDGLRRSFPERVLGYSDHTLPDERMLILTAAWLKGAAVLEKHFTHNKTLPGNDHYHAADVDDLKRFRENLVLLDDVLGESHKQPLPSEQISRANARRSIVINRSLAAGAIIEETDITYKRPGSGISPLYWDEVIGARARTDLDEDHILQWSDISS
jgi:sialic acid synthase SpsE